MTPVNVNFDVAVAGSTRPLAPPHRDKKSDAFGDTLQGALGHADDSSIDRTTIDRRPRSRRDPDSDASERADKDSDTDKTSPTDVVTLGGNGELIRKQPVPPPADETGTSPASADSPDGTTTTDLSDALADLANATDGATGSATGATPTTPTGDVARQAALRLLADARNRSTDQTRSLAAIDSEVANNLALLQQMAGAPATSQTETADNQLTEGEWRRAMVTRLSNLIESSPSDRSNGAITRAAVPQLPGAAELNKALAAMVNQATEERGSTAAKAGAASGISELFEADRSSSFDRQALSQFNQLRMEPPAVTPLRLTTDAVSTPSAPIEQRSIDTDLPEQIIQSIRVQALDLGSEARVRLRPGYLGEVVVSVKVDAGAVTATLQADTPAVRRWIETHEASLRIGLADHGLHLDRLIVSEPGKSESDPEERRRQQQEQPAQQESRRSQRKREDPGTFEVVV